MKNSWEIPAKSKPSSAWLYVKSLSARSKVIAKTKNDYSTRSFHPTDFLPFFICSEITEPQIFASVFGNFIWLY